MIWTYRKETIDQRELLNVLNSLGMQGWEVCGVIRDSWPTVTVLLKCGVKP